VNARIVYLHAISPVHTGTEASVATIDQPIAREAVTNWPYIPGSGLKGVLKDACRGLGDKNLLRAIFGPDPDDEEVTPSEQSGSLVIGDARVLCLPIRSLHGTFAWVTCPLAIARVRRDQEAANLQPIGQVAATSADTQILVAHNAAAIAHNGRVYLEDLDLDAVANAEVAQVAQQIASAVFDSGQWLDWFVARFGVVSDTVFSFLSETSTEVVARVRISDETKTVVPGGLWYEEALPAETICASVFIVLPTARVGPTDLFRVVETNKTVQVGGNATVGRGVVRLSFIGGAT
jgi:CRISPR-associated protein Cmr4